MEAALAIVRSRVPRYEVDRYFAPDLAAMGGLVRDGGLDDAVDFELDPA